MKAFGANDGSQVGQEPDEHSELFIKVGSI
jgi:hypothetical protein